MRSKAAKADRHSGETVVRVGMRGCKVTHVAPTVSVKFAKAVPEWELAQGGVMTSIVTARINYWEKLAEGHVVFNIDVSQTTLPFFEFCVNFCPQTCP